jgi:hypothetical protein
MRDLNDFKYMDTVLVSEEKQNFQGRYYKRYVGFVMDTIPVKKEIMVFNPKEMKLSQIYACQRRVHITTIRMVLTEKVIDKKLDKYRNL